MEEQEIKNQAESTAEVVKEQSEPDIEKPRVTLRKRRETEEAEAKKRALERWIPKTEIGRQVKAGKITDIDSLLEKEKTILEAEIIDTLLPNLSSDLLLIGQSKGKFGGGKRRAWRQTQRKTEESNVITFSSMVIVGDKKGHIGIGYGTSKETLPAREKALRQAKLNIMKITRGFETPEHGSNDPHTVPYKVEGKCGSIRMKIIPAPRGTGLVVGDECKKILRLAGIKDVYGVTRGQTRTTFNVAKACMDALKKTNEMET